MANLEMRTQFGGLQLRCPATLLSAVLLVGLAWAGPQHVFADAVLSPADLLARVQANADRIVRLEFTLYRSVHATGGVPSPEPAIEHYVYEPTRQRSQVRYESPVSGIGWEADLVGNVYITRTPGGELRMPLSMVARLQPPNLVEFCPPPAAVYCPQWTYGIYDLAAAGEAEVGGERASVVRCTLPGVASAGWIDLVIEQRRGVLLSERIYAQSGVLRHEITLSGYADMGGVWIPMGIGERSVARMNEVQVSLSYEDVHVRTAEHRPRGLRRAKERASPQNRGLERARERAAPQAGGVGGGGR